MAPSESKIRRSIERAGPLVVALLLGAGLVASSGLSYRDARLAAGLVAQRQGIGLLHRIDAELMPRADGAPGKIAGALPTILAANRSLGLLYIGVFDGDRIVEQVGRPLMPDRRPRVGSPTFGYGRVRMVSPGPHEESRDGFPGLFGEGDPGAGMGEPRGPDHPPPPRGRRPPQHMVIEFEPIGSADAVGRALNVLWLSSGAAVLLAAAALILSTKARRADRVEAQLSAQRHLARLGEMSAVLAHEIRNPLAALKGHAQLLGERVAEPDLAARVDRVVTEAIRLEHLTNDLLEFARSGAIRVGPASPVELMERAARATDPARVERLAQGAPDFAQVDAARIEQVLINLMENALQVTPPALKVQVAATTVGRTGLLFTVRDHGPGVPSADRTRIFEPFHTTRTGGTGLGLAVASRIVELHGGRIEVLDAVGGGAVFQVHLPEARANGR